MVKTVVSLSGGKDSTAMLLEMLRRGEQIDEIIFCDTTVEFPVLYQHLDKLEEYIGRKITRLTPDKDFEYYLCDHKKTRGRKTHVTGYGFPTAGARWCTSYLKRDAINKYLSERYGEEKVCQCIGLAADELERADQDRLAAGEVRYPLIEYGITEEEALKTAYLCGFDWGALQV